MDKTNTAILRYNNKFVLVKAKTEEHINVAKNGKPRWNRLYL